MSIVSIPMPTRSVHIRLALDANRINARGQLVHMNQIERWRQDEVIEVLMSATAQSEAARGNQRRAEKSFGYIFTESRPSTAAEQQELLAIERLLFPGGAQTTNERNDVDIVFNAAKYVAILVTADGGSTSQPGGMLGNRRELRRLLNLRVMSDAEAAEHIRSRIAERDKIAELAAGATGSSLPLWVGAD